MASRYFRTHRPDESKSRWEDLQRHMSRLPPEPSLRADRCRTDPQRANSFGQSVAAGLPFPAAVKPILDKLKARAFSDDGISAADQAIDANQVVWRATGQYLARPLTGVWATAPYLHSGSVPTLWHLLHPAQRPAKFIVGNREYDPARLGYSTDGSGWIFDTSQPGNSNIGHAGDKYGTNLNEDQKASLLEYLKTI